MRREVGSANGENKRSNKMNEMLLTLFVVSWFALAAEIGWESGGRWSFEKMMLWNVTIQFMVGTYLYFWIKLL